MTNMLPQGWIRTALGSIRVSRARRAMPYEHPGETFELYSVPAFPEEDPEVVIGKDVGSDKQTVEPGTVLVCKINPRINRIWTVGDRTPHPKIASTEWIPFFPVEGIEPRFLQYYLRQDCFRDYLAANVSGVGGSLMRVRPAVVDRYPFPLAPLPEQRRIVAAIEEHFTKLDAAVAALERVRANLRRYRASVLQAACSGRLVPTEAELARAEGRDYEPPDELLQRILKERRARWEAAELEKMQARGKLPKDERWRVKYQEPAAPDTSQLPELPEGWVWQRVEQVGEVVTGTTPSTKDPNNFNGELPFFKPTDLDAGYYVTQAREHLSDKGAQSARVLPPFSILVTCIGATIGKTGLARVRCTTNQQINALVRASESVSASYLFYWFSSPAGQEAIKSNASATTLPILNKTRFEAIALPLPPAAEQERIVAVVDRRLSGVEKLEAEVEQALARAGRLRQAILRRAFAGRLVPQDPRDEPASALLERIRGEGVRGVPR